MNRPTPYRLSLLSTSILLLFFPCIGSNAMNHLANPPRVSGESIFNATITPLPFSESIISTWYEWPHEGTNETIVFKKTKYIPVPGIDKQDERFRMWVIKDDGTFIQSEYCGYCPNQIIEEKTGTYEIVANRNLITGMKISFPGGSAEELNINALQGEILIVNQTELDKLK